MLAGLFRSNQPVVQFAMPLMVLLLFAPSYRSPSPGFENAMPLAELVEEVLRDCAWARHTLGIILIMMLSVQLTSLVNGADLMDRRNHLPALLLPLWLAGLDQEGPYHPALLGMPLVLVALRLTLSMSNTGTALRTLFDAGLLIGLAALCYLPFAFLLVMLWASASVIRPFAWREYVLPALAISLVFYLAWGALHLAGHTPWYPLRTMVEASVAAQRSSSAARMLFLGLGTALFLDALTMFASSYARSVMRGKNLRSSFLSFAMALGVILGVQQFINGRFPTVLGAVPLAVISSYDLLTPRKRWLAEFAALGLLASACWQRWV